MQTYHTSVLLREVVQLLQIKSGENYIDATLGGGGHSLAILEAGGRVLSIDQDDDALDHVREFTIENSKFKIDTDICLVKGNFREIDTIARERGFANVAGILFDLGVSSHQLDTAERGFSFQLNGPLDMRMDKSLSVSARDLINGLTKHELSELFFKLGEEYRSRVIAQAIIKEREKKPIETTEELERIIRHELGGRFSKTGKHTSTHPATKVFQALRIVINDEVHALEEALPKSLTLLKPGGRLAVISFHSLEDRVVKHTFKAFEQKGLGTIITDKPLVPTVDEVTQNARSRSSKLRVFEKSL